MMKGRQEINQMKFDICQEVMQFDSVFHICFACLHASFTSQRPSGCVVELWIERRYQGGHIVNSQQKLEENRQSVPRA